MNNAEAEIGALEVLWDRVVPGAVVILDDYGWAGCLEQKRAEDVFLTERGYQVLELPTGQGLLIK
jgi:predicted O-methyltransferase YrrM